MERVMGQELDPDVVWTDGSKLGSGEVGVGVAWYEEVLGSEQVGSVSVSRRGFCRVGERREQKGRTYQDERRSFGGARSGWITRGFGMGVGHEAYDAELSALVYGLIHLLGRRERGRAYTIFTDSTAAMTRAASDAPGPGQETAIQITGLAQRVVGQENTIAIRWTPAHRGVEGNERADQEARERATTPPSGPRLGTIAQPPSAKGHRAGYSGMEEGYR